MPGRFVDFAGIEPNQGNQPSVYLRKSNVRIMLSFEEANGQRYLVLPTEPRKLFSKPKLWIMFRRFPSKTSSPTLPNMSPSYPTTTHTTHTTLQPLPVHTLRMLAHTQQASARCLLLSVAVRRRVEGEVAAVLVEGAVAASPVEGAVASAEQ